MRNEGDIMAKPKIKSDDTIDVPAIISAAVNAGLQAGRLQGARVAGDLHKATEKRLFAYPVLLQKIEDDTEKMERLTTDGTPERSKSIVRFNRTGSRLSPDEILEGLIMDLAATIAADQHETEIIEDALQTIQADPYYDTVAQKFIEGMNDEEIAATIPCDPSTVRRNRGRLVRKLTVRLYGAEAL